MDIQSIIDSINEGDAILKGNELIASDSGLDLFKLTDSQINTIKKSSAFTGIPLINSNVDWTLGLYNDPSSDYRNNLNFTTQTMPNLTISKDKSALLFPDSTKNYNLFVDGGYSHDEIVKQGYVAIGWDLNENFNSWNNANESQNKYFSGIYDMDVANIFKYYANQQDSDITNALSNIPKNTIQYYNQIPAKTSLSLDITGFSQVIGNTSNYYVGTMTNDLTSYTVQSNKNIITSNIWNSISGIKQSDDWKNQQPMINKLSELSTAMITAFNNYVIKNPIGKSDIGTKIINDLIQTKIYSLSETVFGNETEFANMQKKYNDFVTTELLDKYFDDILNEAIFNYNNQAAILNKAIDDKLLNDNDTSIHHQVEPNSEGTRDITEEGASADTAGEGIDTKTVFDENFFGIDIQSPKMIIIVPTVIVVGYYFIKNIPILYNKLI